MSSVALSVLTLTLGMFFILIGQFKVTPKYFPDIHEDMRREFGRINKVFPLYQITNWRPYAKNYRMTIGILEIVCGAVLVLIPGRLKQIANTILLMLMLGAVYTHYTLHDKFDRMAPGIIFSLLLSTRLIIYWQGKYAHLNILNQKQPYESKKKIQIEEDENTQESIDEETDEKKKD
ncbi:unnamed protein product [Adineta steineri]|uniref:Novel acetylcholine receptor chaperone n=1 Tax=Adineta steineri TaxID=433720 RepID=A0A814K0R9_9BILA|nr:unnamed protein product [Adineta steineri]CAF1157984.1 unnamed protein product [Adineta steineri]CAF1255790.1 unnamed protein product [Adineta steineri]